MSRSRSASDERDEAWDDEDREGFSKSQPEASRRYFTGSGHTLGDTQTATKTISDRSKEEFPRDEALKSSQTVRLSCWK